MCVTLMNSGQTTSERAADTWRRAVRLGPNGLAKGIETQPSPGAVPRDEADGHESVTFSDTSELFTIDHVPNDPQIPIGPLARCYRCGES